MNRPSLSHRVLDRAVSGELKVYRYDEGICFSALSIEDARRYLGELLPWPTTVMDAALVREMEDAELDRCHFYWDKKAEDENSCSFRQELQRRMADGELEPATFYDGMCLVPSEPRYVLAGWIAMRHRYLPPLEKPVWTTDGKSVVRGTCHSPLNKSIRDHHYWMDENRSPIKVTHWRYIEDSPLEPKLPE